MDSRTITFKEALDNSSTARSLYNRLLSNIDLSFWYSFSDELEGYDDELATFLRMLNSDVSMDLQNILVTLRYFINPYSENLEGKRLDILGDSEVYWDYELDLSINSWRMMDYDMPRAKIDTIPIKVLRSAILIILKHYHRFFND